MIEPNQCMEQDLSLSVSCAILISLATDVILRKLLYQYRDGFYLIFGYFLQVVVVGSTSNYVYRLGTLWFCYKYVEKLSPNPGTCLF